MTAPLHILLVDDSPEDRRAIRRVLLTHPTQHFKIYEAADAQAGLDLLEARAERPIDAVLLDMNLPSVDGLEFLQTLQAADGFIDVPVIVLTGASTYDLRHALEAGAQDLIYKTSVNTTSYARDLYRAIQAAMERHRIAGQLRDTEQRFREIAVTLDQVFWVYDVHERKTQYLSPAFETLFGAPPEAIYAGQIAPSDFTHPEDRGRVEAQFTTWLETGCAQEYREEYRILTADGTLRWVQNVGQAVADSQVHRAVGLIRDITQRKTYELTLEEQEAQLRSLNAALEARVAEQSHRAQALGEALAVAEERERLNIAQILHDDLQQLFYSQQFRISLFRKALAQGIPEHADQLLGTLRDLVDRSIHLTRTLVSQLETVNPANLDEGLAWLSRHMETYYDFETTVRIEGTPQFESRLSNVVMYILRELLFNVVKHAGVQAASVTARADEHGTTLTIRDEGRGFDPERMHQSADRQHAFGLRGIAERVGLLGGTFRVESRPEQGTTVYLYLPHTPASYRSPTPT